MSACRCHHARRRGRGSERSSIIIDTRIGCWPSACKQIHSFNRMKSVPLTMATNSSRIAQVVMRVSPTQQHEEFDDPACLALLWKRQRGVTGRILSRARHPADFLTVTFTKTSLSQNLGTKMTVEFKGFMHLFVGLRAIEAFLLPLRIPLNCTLPKLMETL